MNLKVTQWSGRYLEVLRKHLRQNPRTSLQPALELGREAVVLGLETLELARMHEEALATLKSSHPLDGLARQAELFFNEVMIPIVETHHAARQSKMDLNRVTEALTKRTSELGVSSRQLKRGILLRQKVEAALKSSGLRYRKLLKESLHLQEGLRQLTHQVLVAQEAERKKISTELQDEIAQTLLGINVRLITLKKEARHNTSGLKNEIASTQRLVAKSAQTVRAVARKLRYT